MTVAADPALVESVRRRLTWVGWGANGSALLVVGVAIGFVTGIFFSEEITWGYVARTAPIMAVYFVIAGVVITKVSAQRSHAAFGWISEGREPTEGEHRLAMRHAAYLTLLGGLAWMLGGPIFILVSLDQSFGFVAAGSAAALLGAETTCAIVYLLAERVLRPLTARTLTARPVSHPVGPSVRMRLQFAWSLGTGVPLLGVLFVATAAILKPDVDTEAVAAAVIFLAIVAFAIGWLVTMVTARAIADPVTKVRSAVDRVAAGDLDAKVTIDDASEIGLLQAGFNRMADGLRERERIRDIFGRQVGEDVARAALRDGTRLGGEEREIGALFIDIVGSTSMALAMPPTEVVRLLNRFFRVVIEVVEAEGGLVNKFEGDGALCVFGAPVASDDPAADALRAARKLAERLEREVPEIGFGIGVSAGSAVAGNVGAEQRFEYTVIGDPVNEAARLSDLAKQREMTVVASDAALGRADPNESERWSVTERTVLRGRLEATAIASPR
jgi:adenylate cyclase